MRSIALISAASLFLAVGARAQDMDPAQAEKVKAETAAEAEQARQAGMPMADASKAQAAAADQAIAKRKADRWGLAIGAGFPDGASAVVLFRPVTAVRLWAGPAFNYFAWGGQVGVAAVPWNFVVTPVVSAEAGYYFKADASFLASNSKGIPAELKPLLKDMGCFYAAGHVGIEIGGQRSLSLFVRAGIAYLSLSSHGTFTKTDATSGATVTFSDPKVTGTVPSVKAGVQYWF